MIWKDETKRYSTFVKPHSVFDYNVMNKRLKTSKPKNIVANQTNPIKKAKANAPDPTPNNSKPAPPPPGAGGGVGLGGGAGRGKDCY